MFFENRSMFNKKTKEKGYEEEGKEEGEEKKTKIFNYKSEMNPKWGTKRKKKKEKEDLKG